MEKWLEKALSYLYLTYLLSLLQAGACVGGGVRRRTGRPAARWRAASRREAGHASSPTRRCAGGRPQTAAAEARAGGAARPPAASAQAARAFPGRQGAGGGARGARRPPGSRGARGGAKAARHQGRGAADHHGRAGRLHVVFYFLFL